MDNTKVLIVDDSAVVRQVISGMVDSSRGMEVCGTAADPIFAELKMQKTWPDVIVLDIEMPRMDGLTFLEKIMKDRPTPVVMCSTLTESGTVETMKAIGLGAAGIVAKPKENLKQRLTDFSEELLDAIRGASTVNIKALKSSARACNSLKQTAPKFNADVILSKSTSKLSRTRVSQKIVAIGTSTGGPQALEQVLPKLNVYSPPIVVVQHMPEKFTKAFAERLNSICSIDVKEAKSGDRVISGRVLIAPGGKHMLLEFSGSNVIVKVKGGPKVNRHKPSVDVLFRSVAKVCGKNAMGIIMTGMGDDGVTGLEEMHGAGALTIGQDEASSVVYGMAAVAMQRGVIDRQVALSEIFMQIAAFSK